MQNTIARIRVFLAISSLIFVDFASAVDLKPASAAIEPFWRAKPKVFEKITNERQVVVSVNAEKIKNPGAGDTNKNILRMDGAGLVNTEVEPTYLEAQKYDELKQISDHVIEVKVGPSPQDVFIHTEAYNYHARMTMRVTPAKDKDGSRHLRFQVLEGNFKGMTGEFSFSAYQPTGALGKLVKNATVLGFHAEYEYTVLPMPQFFVEFGIEVVLQRVASRMRSFLEEKLTAKAAK